MTPYVPSIWKRPSMGPVSGQNHPQPTRFKPPECTLSWTIQRILSIMVDMGFGFFFLPTQHQVSFSSNSALISLVVYFFTLVTVIISAMGIEPKPFHWETTLKLGANIVKEALFTGVAKLIGWRLRACSQKKETFLEKHSGNRSKLQREDVEVHYLYIYIQSNMKPNTSMDF